ASAVVKRVSAVTQVEIANAGGKYCQAIPAARPERDRPKSRPIRNKQIDVSRSDRICMGNINLIGAPVSRAETARTAGYSGGTLLSGRLSGPLKRCCVTNRSAVGR